MLTIETTETTKTNAKNGARRSNEMRVFTNTLDALRDRLAAKTTAPPKDWLALTGTRERRKRSNKVKHAKLTIQPQNFAE